MLVVLTVTAGLVLAAVAAAGWDRGASEPGTGATGGAPFAKPVALQVRPVECAAPRFFVAPGHAARSPKVLPRCTPPTLMTGANLNVQPATSSASGYAVAQVPPDLAFASYRSTSGRAINAASTVLLGQGPPNPSNPRYVLGPVLLTRRAVARAEAARSPQGQWVVNLLLTKPGSQVWDRATQQYFHQFLAVVVDRRLLMEALIEPTQTSWSSFNRQLQLSGGLSHRDATDIAAGLSPRP